MAGYAESAYQQISADLKHDLSFKVPLILFKTHSEFEQENVAPGEAGRKASARSPSRRATAWCCRSTSRRTMLYGLIVHELTHIFEFDIIPQSLIRRSVPLWVNEGPVGLRARASGTPIDLMTVRDAAVADIVPKMTRARRATATRTTRA